MLLIIVHDFDVSLCIIIDMTREEGFNERASFPDWMGICYLFFKTENENFQYGDQKLLFLIRKF